MAHVKVVYKYLRVWHFQFPVIIEIAQRSIILLDYIYFRYRQLTY